MSATSDAAFTDINISDPAPFTGEAMQSILKNPWIKDAGLSVESTPADFLNAFEDAATVAINQDLDTSVEVAWWLRGLGARAAGLPLSVFHDELACGEYGSQIIFGWTYGGCCERCKSEDALYAVWPCSVPHDQWGAMLVAAVLGGHSRDVAFLLSHRPKGGRVLCECEWCGCGQSKSAAESDCRDCVQAAEESEADYWSGEDGDDFHDERSCGPDYWRNEDGEYRCG